MDQSQTTCYCHFSCFSPHFTKTTAPLGIHFGIQCANFVFTWFEKCRCSVCSAAHPSNWLSARQALNAWLEMFQQAISAQLFPSNSEKTFLIIFTMLLTPGSLPPVVLFHLGLCGAGCPATSPPGPVGVWPPAGQDPPPHTPGPPPHPHPTTAFFSPAC